MSFNKNFEKLSRFTIDEEFKKVVQMVNTFLTDVSFSESAKNLDSRRLGKQRVEAYQILCILEDLHFICSQLGLPAYDNPSNDLDSKKEWIRTIVKEYKSKNYRYFKLCDGNLLTLGRSNLPIRLKEKKSNGYSIEGSVVTLENGETKHRFQVMLRGDRLINFGFVYHPCVCMWLGFEDSLQNYIQAHIDEWKSRGYLNTMKEYSIVQEAERPSWTFNQELIENHRGSLLNKEVQRKEKSWYILNNKFTTAKPFEGYIWFN